PCDSVAVVRARLEADAAAEVLNSPEALDALVHWLRQPPAPARRRAPAALGRETAVPTLEVTVMTMTAATIAADARAERAADRTGVQTAEVERLPFDLSVLEDEGLFVNVDGRGFGLLDRRLDWHALGI